MDIIDLALKEDIGTGDISANLLGNKEIKAQVICREKAIICGIDVFNQCFKNIKIKWHIKNGDLVNSGDILCELEGNNREILTKERTALNFLQTLSSVSTQVFNLIKKIKHTNTKILDTRKTLPAMRKMQKDAVKCGGGFNHRFGLYDAILLKENHIHQTSITNIVNIARQKHFDIDIIVEVENLTQLREANKLDITRILCDNFDIKTLKEAVKISDIPLEASGNINTDNIIQFAETGVDFISIGSITKNIQAIDLSLLLC